MQSYGQRNRERVKDERSSSTRTGYSTVTGVSWSAVDLKAKGQYKKTNDVVTSRYAELSRKGTVVMSPYQSIVANLTQEHTQACKLEQPPGSGGQGWYNTGFGNFCTGRGHSPGDYWLGTGLDLISAEDRQALAVEASTRVLSQIGRSNVDWWENIAEVNKSMELLKHPFASWFRVHNRKNSWQKDLLQSTPSLYLLLRYGVQPLVTSVNGVLNNLKKSTRPTRVTTRASAADSRRRDDTGRTSTTYWGSCELQYKRSTTETLQYRAMSIDKMISDFEYTYGLSSKQLLTLPWELIPWSFVVDWALNVGDFLGALAQSLYPSSLGQCLVSTRTVTEYREATNTVAWSPSTIEVKQPFGGWSRADIVWKNRVVGLTGPGLVIKSNLRLESVTRAADTFALITQQIQRAGELFDVAWKARKRVTV